MSIGIDSVDIIRFTQWTEYSYKKLSRIYSQQEIDYCFSDKAKTAERLAVRFAAKEAVFKALTSLTQTPLSFLAVCKACSTENNTLGQPIMHVDWQALDLMQQTIHISFTHTSSVATAVALLS